MFEVTVETEQLHDLSELLAKTVHESLVTFYPPDAEDAPGDLDGGGVWIQDSGEDQVVYTDMQMTESFFEEFEVSEPMAVGLPWRGNPGVQDITDKASGRKITVSTDYDDNYVHFHGSDGMHFKMAPIDVDSMSNTEPPTARWPDYEYAFTFDTTMQEFENAIGVVDLVTERAQIVVSDDWDGEYNASDDAERAVFLKGVGDNHESTSPPLDMLEDPDATLVETAFDTDILRSFIKPINKNAMGGKLYVSMIETITRSSDGSVLDGTEMWLPATFSTNLYGDINTEFTVAPLNKQE